MVFSKEDTIEIEQLKQKHKVEYEELRHKNRMAELIAELEIAVTGKEA